MADTAPQIRFWHEGAWSCEFWLTGGGKGELRLYDGADLHRTHAIQGGESALAMSRAWRAFVLRDERAPE